MRRVGNEDLRALALASICEVRAHDHEPEQLALRACRRLQGHGVETGDLCENLLESPDQLEGPLTTVNLLMRVKVPEAWKLDNPLVDPRIVFHGAGAQRIEAGVDTVVPRGQLREVPDDLGLGNLREPGRSNASVALEVYGSSGRA